MVTESSPSRAGRSTAIGALIRGVVICCLIAACSSGGGGGDDDGGNAGGDPIFGDAPNIGSGLLDAGRCATENLDDDTLAQLSSLFDDFRAKRSPLTKSRFAAKGETTSIPVIFHVLMKGSSFEDGNLPDTMLQAQVDQLNRAFSGGTGGVVTPFRFHLAGINRVNRPEWFTLAPDSQLEFDVKTALRQGGPETLNIYTANTEGGILGYATFPILYALLPKVDGIVLNYQILPGGPKEHYNQGLIGAHEAGHWLGLLHTFSGECVNPFGDLVADTPPEEIPEKGQFCPVNRDSCPNVDGVDPIHNHMTYTDDGCRTEFTQGQLELMLFNSAFFRFLDV